jgi:PAS domain S-box-containing protein
MAGARAGTAVTPIGKPVGGMSTPPLGSNADAPTGYSSGRIPPDRVTIEQHEERFRSLFIDGPAGQAFAGLDGRLAAANAAFCRILGSGEADVVGRTFLELTHPDDRERNRQLVSELVEGRIASFQLAKRYLRADGTPVPVLNTVAMVQTAEERFIAAVCVELRQQTQVRQPLRVEIDVRSGAMHEVADDELDHWLEDWPAELDQLHLNWLWDAVVNTGQELVLALDPNGVMRYLSEASTDLLGASPSDLVGRSIFEIIHPDDTTAARQAFADRPVSGTHREHVRLRALRPDGGTPWLQSSSVAHVDNHGKLLGRTATMRRLGGDEAHAAQLEASRARVQELLAGHQLRTVWQPIFSLDNGHITGVEALTRFSHSRVEQPTDRWFYEAHKAGLGQQLEILAIETALASARSLPSSLYLSMNVSPSTVAEGGIASVIEQSAVPPDRIVLELTEHVSIEDYDAFLPALESLRQTGLRLAVDDAGAGFASFRHILRLAPDIIKLDQSITRGIDSNAAQRALAAALVMFALDVGSTIVVAEGVETEAELSTVATLGIDAVQGYYLARPTDADDIEFDTVTPHAWSGKA